MLERLKGEGGQIDPAKVAAMRERFCSADGAQPRFDPARFAVLRTALGCDDLSKEVDAANLPPQVLDRVRGPDGQVDPAKLAELRQRVCAMQAPAAAEGGSQAGPAADLRSAADAAVTGRGAGTCRSTTRSSCATKC